MSNENTSTWSKIKENVSTTFSAVSNWFAQTSVGEWIIDKYNDIFDKDNKESEKNGKSTEKETKTVYDVVGAGNCRYATFDTHAEADKWRKDNSPSSTVVEREVEVEKTTESEKGSKDSANPNAGKWTVWVAGAPVGGVLDTKEEAEQLRKDKYQTGTVRSWDEIYGKRVAEASEIVASDGTSNEATAEMD